jgi:hypothetical protein
VVFNAEGWRGEVELVRNLSQNENLNIFHAKPDSEFAEYAALHVKTGQIIGLQVKSGSASLTDYAYEFRFAPHPKLPTKVDPYRISTTQLARMVEGLLERPAHRP